MFPSGTPINEYYDYALTEVRRDVHSRGEAYVLGVDIEEYTDYLFNKYSLREVMFDDSRKQAMEKMRKEGYPWLRVYLPVKPDDTIELILRLQPGATYGYRISRMGYESGNIVTEVPADQSELQSAIGYIRQEVEWRNNDIRRYNRKFKQDIHSIIQQEKKRIESEDALLEAIVKKVPIILKQKQGTPSSIAPLKIKRKIQPIMPPTASRPVEPVLEKEQFDGIMSIIDNCCKAFESTPATFAKMEEEDLRNIILSNLNGIYEGAAVGEAFAKSGKTDIYLKIDKGGIFKAECKYWRGAKSIQEAIDQILGYLTWRNSVGVVIVFSRNKGFTNVIDEVLKAASHVASSLKSFKKLDRTHFCGAYSLPEDDKKLIELHFLVYNLYVSS